MQTDNLRTRLQYDMDNYTECKPGVRNSSHNSKNLPSSLMKQSKLGGENSFSKNSPNNDSASTKEDNSSYLNEESIFSNGLYTAHSNSNTNGNTNVRNFDSNIRDFKNGETTFKKPVKHTSGNMLNLSKQLENTHIGHLGIPLEDCTDDFQNCQATKKSGGVPMTQASSCQSPSLKSLMPPTEPVGRRRFYSSIHDLRGLETGPQYYQRLEEQSSTKSTAVSNISALERHEITEAQVKREQNVLKKLKEIWKDAYEVQKELQSGQAITNFPSRVAKVLKPQENVSGSSQSISISAELNIETPTNGGTFFIQHQQNLRCENVKKMQENLTQKVNNLIVPGQNKLTALADLIMAELDVQPQPEAHNALSLQPQFSSDFLSFTSLQKEIDEKCLRNQLSLNNKSSSFGI